MERYAKNATEVKISSVNIDFIEVVSNQNGVHTIKLKALSERNMNVRTKRAGKSQIAFKKDHPGRAVLVMMTFPRNEKGTESRDSKLNHLYAQIESRLSKYGLDAVRADKKEYCTSHWMWDNVRVYMDMSDFGIAVLDKLFDDQMNPNVAVEYGYMQALKRPTLLLKQKDFKNIRADLLGKLWQEFSFNDKASIDRAIDQWMIDLAIPLIEL